MSGHVYKKIELVGSSAVSIDDAVRNALAKAAETLKHLDWFEVTEMRGHLQNGQIAHWQVGLKVGMRVDRED